MRATIHRNQACLAGLILLAGTAVSRAATNYPPNFSFETPVKADGSYYDVTDSSPDWKATNGYVTIFNPAAVAIAPTGWCPPPTDGNQLIAWMAIGVTVYQLLPDTAQAGSTYVLMADAGDSKYQSSSFHPTAVLTLCYGTSETAPDTWTPLAQKTSTLAGYGDVFGIETPAYVARGSAVGKRLGIKLTYAQPTAPQISINFDLTWDNIRIVATPPPGTVIELR